jgi:hypothetical protein
MTAAQGEGRGDEDIALAFPMLAATATP